MRSSRYVWLEHWQFFRGYHRLMYDLGLLLPDQPQRSPVVLVEDSTLDRCVAVELAQTEPPRAGFQESHHRITGDSRSALWGNGARAPTFPN